MAEFTDYFENKILNSLRNVAGVQCVAYVALFTTATTDAGGGTEVTGGSYARQLAGLASATGTSGTTYNAADITFPVATSGWGTVTHMALMDSITGGNMLMHTPVEVPKIVGSGDTFKISANGITVTVA